jgi:hypothetical protein
LIIFGGVNQNAGVGRAANIQSNFSIDSKVSTPKGLTRLIGLILIAMGVQFALTRMRSFMFETDHAAP